MTAPRVCIDRLLPRDLHRWTPTVLHRDILRAVLEYRKMWANGSTLRVRFLGGSPSQQAKAHEQALWWTRYANLTFEFGDAREADIRIAFDPDDGAWSYIGTDCKAIPLNQPTMNLGFLDGGTAAHEFGHAVGLAHEHQNPAGGIEWNEEAVIRDLSGSPNYWDPDTIRHNVIEKYSVDQIRGTAFDSQSIMLYAFPAAWTRNGLATHANEDLSTLDKQFIASAQAYPKTTEPSPAAVMLTVNATRGTRGSIGAAGEEDLYAFTAVQGGRYLVETRGQTDVVMRLFGPDSPTQLVAEDDDSGVGVNARVIADLMPGDYYIQIRHIKPSATSGRYTIRVRQS